MPEDGRLRPAPHGVPDAARDGGDGGVHQHALQKAEEEQVQEDRDDILQDLQGGPSSCTLQGDQAACPKPPVDIDLKLRFSIRSLY